MNDMYAFSLRQIAIIAGLSIVLMALLAGFSYGFVILGNFVPNNPVLTAQNIQSSLILFRWGIASFLVVLLLDIVLAWALYIFLKPVHPHLSLLAACFRLVFAGMFGSALLCLVLVTLILSDASYLSVFEMSQKNALALFFLYAFQRIWAMSLVIFGFYLVIIGYIAFKAVHIPRIWGILLIIAGLCYVGSNFADVLWVDYPRYKATVEAITTLPMVVGELGFGIWLWGWGGKAGKAVTIL